MAKAPTNPPRNGEGDQPQAGGGALAFAYKAIWSVGFLIGAMVSNLGSLDLAPSLPLVFAAGALAVSAWLLPGVSGSFVLLVLGVYPRMIEALSVLDLLRPAPDDVLECVRVVPVSRD